MIQKYMGPILYAKLNPYRIYHYWTYCVDEPGVVRKPHWSPTLSMFTISCYISPRCGGTRLYIICVESDYTCAQMNQGWRPVHVDIHISLTFHLCSMPNLIYEYYAASLLYRAKLYVIHIIFIISHICATLPTPELHLTEMVCFQCFICLHVFHILFTDFRLFVFMFDSRRFLNWDRHPAFFVILYHDRRWTGRRAIFW